MFINKLVIFHLKLYVLMAIDIKEEIGSYTIIRNGSFIIYNNETVKFNFEEDGSDPMYLEIRFLSDDSGKSDISQEIVDNTMVIKMVNFTRGITGMFEPVEVAKSDDGSIIYLSLILRTFDAKDGNRLLHYSFLTRK